MKGYITNEWDRDNLEFLLNIGDSELTEWHKQADAEDLLYAQELMAAYSRELSLRSQELVIEATLDKTNYREANSILNRFRN